MKLLESHASLDGASTVNHLRDAHQRASQMSDGTAAIYLHSMQDQCSRSLWPKFRRQSFLYQVGSSTSRTETFNSGLIGHSRCYRSVKENFASGRNRGAKYYQEAGQEEIEEEEERRSPPKR
jgi:hypothetical protein